MEITLDNGYKLVSTFWNDFLIADAFGENSIKDTFRRAFSVWKDDTTYGMELAIVMSLKSGWWYGKNGNKFSALYSELYDKIDGYIMSHYKKDDVRRYLEITD